MRWGRSSRSRRPPGCALRQVYRCWSTPPSRSGRTPLPTGWSLLAGQRPQVGWPGRRRCPRRAQGHPLGAALGRSLEVTGSGRPGGGGRRGGAAGRARRGRGGGGPAERARRGDPRHGRRDRARRRGGRRAHRAAAAHRDVLLPVRRRRGPAARPGPGRLRGVLGLGLHRRHPRALARPGRDGRADPRQRPGVAAQWSVRRTTSTAVPRRAARPRSRTCGRRWGM